MTAYLWLREYSIQGFAQICIDAYSLTPFRMRVARVQDAKRRQLRL